MDRYIELLELSTKDMYLIHSTRTSLNCGGLFEEKCFATDSAGRGSASVQSYTQKASGSSKASSILSEQATEVIEIVDDAEDEAGVTGTPVPKGTPYPKSPPLTQEREVSQGSILSPMSSIKKIKLNMDEARSSADSSVAKRQHRQALEMQGLFATKVLAKVKIGSIVLLHMDKRDRSRANPLGVVGIVFNIHKSKDGMSSSFEVVTEEGIIGQTQKGKKQKFFAHDQLIVPKVQPTLTETLYDILEEINAGEFNPKEYRRLTLRKAHELQCGHKAFGRESCKCKKGCASKSCSCVKRGSSCHSGCRCCGSCHNPNN